MSYIWKGGLILHSTCCSLKSFSNGFYVHKTSLYVFMFRAIKQENGDILHVYNSFGVL